MDASRVPDDLQREILAVAGHLGSGPLRERVPLPEEFEQQLTALGESLAARFHGEKVLPRDVITWSLWIFAELVRLAERLPLDDPRRGLPWRWFEHLEEAFGRISITG